MSPNRVELILSPSDFIALTNSTLEYAFGTTVYIEGELANLKISKNRWIYFDIKDEEAKISCFGSIYNLPGPLADGMIIKIAGQPHLHPQYGFKINIQTIKPSGEGSIKKAYDLLKTALLKEGLFDEDRKRLLPYPPRKIALITSLESAAYADFIKILNVRWPFIKVVVYDVQVQGESAPEQITKAINQATSEATFPDVLVLTRGGGSADDLIAFNDERVVRAIAASRIPTLVAIGHEIDWSLSELAADKRASTPSNAAELLVPNKHEEIKHINNLKLRLRDNLKSFVNLELSRLKDKEERIINGLKSIINQQADYLRAIKSLIIAYSPERVLKRGYAIIRSRNEIICSVTNTQVADKLNLELIDGRLDVDVEAVHTN